MDRTRPTASTTALRRRVDELTERLTARNIEWRTHVDSVPEDPIFQIATLAGLLDIDPLGAVQIEITLDDLEIAERQLRSVHDEFARTAHDKKPPVGDDDPKFGPRAAPPGRTGGLWLGSPISPSVFVTVDNPFIRTFDTFNAIWWSHLDIQVATGDWTSVEFLINERKVGQTFYPVLKTALWRDLKAETIGFPSSHYLPVDDNGWSRGNQLELRLTNDQQFAFVRNWRIHYEQR